MDKRKLEVLEQALKKAKRHGLHMQIEYLQREYIKELERYIEHLEAVQYRIQTETNYIKN
jgi:hypothetical protein